MPQPQRIIIETNSPDETLQLGRRLGGALEAGDVVALTGPLGAGKTLLTRGLALGSGAGERVTSPTFKLVNEYGGRVRLYHIDAYRLNGPEDLVALGCGEFFDGDGAAVVEWADRVAAALPPERLHVEIRITGPSSRRLVLSGDGPRAVRLLGAVGS